MNDYDVDCTQGVFEVRQVTTWPGDCICSVDLLMLSTSELPTDATFSGLEEVYKLEFESNSQREGLFPDLAHVGSLLVTGSEGLSFPSLKSSENGILILASSEHFQFPVLTESGAISVGYAPIDLQAYPVLENIGTLYVTDQFASPDLSTLVDIEELLWDMSEVSPSTLLAEGIRVDFLEVMEDQRLELGADWSVGKVEIKDGAWLTVDSKPTGLRDIMVRGTLDAQLAMPNTDIFMSSDSVLVAPGPSEMDELVLYGGAWTLDQLLSATDLSVSGGAQVSLPKLASIQDIDVCSNCSLSAPSLTEVDDIDNDGQLELAALTSVDNIYGEGTLTLPALQSATSLSCTGSLSAPALREVSSHISISNCSGTLPALQATGKLGVSDCTQVPALQRVDSVYAETSCDLTELVSLYSATQQHLELYTGDFVLPDGFAEKVWVQDDASLLLNNPGAKVTFTGTSGSEISGMGITSSEHTLQFQYASATSLSGLSSLESAGKLLYCLQSIPEAELDAWLASLQVSGSVTNTCP
jgi:hypothetical protein